MKIERPRFELARVYSDGTQEEPEIISVGQMPWDTKMERRGFLGVGVGIASLLLLLDGKATAQVAPTKSQTSNVPVKVPDKVIKAHLKYVDGLAFSPDGKILASFSGDIKLWSLPDGKLLTILEGHKKSVNAVAISHNGKILASGSTDETIKLWSLSDGKLLATLEGHTKEINALASSPDGKNLGIRFMG